MQKEMRRLLGEKRVVQRWLPGGHVIAVVRARSVFVPAILDGFKLLDRHQQQN